MAETQTGAIVSGVSPERVALAQLDGQRGRRRGRRRHPDRADQPAHAVDLHARRRSRARRRGGRSLRVLRADGRRRASPSACCSPRRSASRQQHSWFPQTGSAELIPLIVIIGRAARHRSRDSRARWRSCASNSAGRRGRGRCSSRRSSRHRVGVVALAVTQGTWRSAVIGTFIAAILGLSYVVVTGFAGQVSLAQLALAGVGAFSLSGITQSWGVPFPFAPLLAALIATGRRHRRRAPGAAAARPDARRRHAGARVRDRSACGSATASSCERRGRAVNHPKLFGLDLAVGTGRRSRASSSDCCASFTLVVVAFGVAWLRTSRARLGDARGPRQRAIGGRHRRERHAREDRQLRASRRSSPASAAASSRTARASSRSTRSPRSAGSRCCRRSYLAGITSVFGGILGGILARELGHRVPRPRPLGRTSGTGSPIISGVALIAR